jgi:hypothetical protein
MSLHLRSQSCLGLHLLIHDLLDALLLLVSEVILLVVVLVGVVKLLPLGAVGDEVGGVTALEATLGVLGASSSLLAKHVRHT